jgi:hypothetical protein
LGGGRTTAAAAGESILAVALRLSLTGGGTLLAEMLAALDDERISAAGEFL